MTGDIVPLAPFCHRAENLEQRFPGHSRDGLSKHILVVIPEIFFFAAGKPGGEEHRFLKRQRSRIHCCRFRAETRASTGDRFTVECFRCLLEKRDAADEEDDLRVFRVIGSRVSVPVKDRVAECFVGLPSEPPRTWIRRDEFSEVGIARWPHAGENHSGSHRRLRSA
jgi:hypothetical protein